MAYADRMYLSGDSIGRRRRGRASVRKKTTSISAHLDDIRRRRFSDSAQINQPQPSLCRHPAHIQPNNCRLDWQCDSEPSTTRAHDFVTHSQSKNFDEGQDSATHISDSQQTSFEARTNHRRNWPILQSTTKNRNISPMQSQALDFAVIDLTRDDDEEDIQPKSGNTLQVEPDATYRHSESYSRSNDNDDLQNAPHFSSRRNTASKNRQENWEEQGSQLEQYDYQNTRYESGDMKYGPSHLENSQILLQKDKGLRKSPFQPSQSKSPRQSHKTYHQANHSSKPKVESSEDEITSRAVGAPALKLQLEINYGNVSSSAIQRQHRTNTQPKHRNIQDWLETSVPPHRGELLRNETFTGTLDGNEDQIETSGYIFAERQSEESRGGLRAWKNSESFSTAETNRTNSHERDLAGNSQDIESYSTVDSSFSWQQLDASQLPAQFKVSVKAALQQSRENNRRTTKIRSQPGQPQPIPHPGLSQNRNGTHGNPGHRLREESDVELGVTSPAKRRKTPRANDRGRPFDPYEPPKGVRRGVALQCLSPAEIVASNNTAIMDLTGMVTDSDDEEAEYQARRQHEQITHLMPNAISGRSTLRIPPEVPTLTEDELLQAQRADEALDAKLVEERARLLEQDQDIQNAWTEERRARLAIGMAEAKAAALEASKKRMVVMEERLKAADDMAAKQEAEEEKRQAAEAERERLKRKEREIATREAVRQRTIQARKESEMLKNKASLAATAPIVVTPFVVAAKPIFATTSARRKQKALAIPSKNDAVPGASTVAPRIAPNGPSQRRKEVEEVKLRAEAFHPLAMSAKALEELAKVEKAKKQAEAQQQKEEAALKAQKDRELREAERQMKKTAKKGDQENRPRKRPVKPLEPQKPETYVEQPKKASKTIGGFIESESESGSDDDALFVSAGKDIPNVTKSFSNVTLDATSPNIPEHNTLNARPPQTTKSPSKISNSSSHPAKSSSSTSKSKTKVLPRSLVIEQPTRIVDGFETRGKTINPEAIAAYLASIHEHGMDDEEDETEPEREHVPAKRCFRQQSPVTERDIYHHVYRVLRKTWYPHLDEEAAEWIVCGKEYTSLQQANGAANREALIEREGFSLQPYVREWRTNLDKHGMAEIYIDCSPNQKNPGFVRIKVNRHLRTIKDGILPNTKIGWIDSTVYEIKKKTTTTVAVSPKPREEWNDLFDEQPEPEIRQHEVIETIDNNIFTLLDEANRKAARFALDLSVPKPENARMDALLEYSKKRKEQQEELDELCDALEKDEETFSADLEFGERTVEISVEARQLKGPRNI